MFILLVMAVMISCNSLKQIGDVNMISTRNIDASMKYKLISSYAGGSDKELSKRSLKKSRATNIESAVSETVKKIPGGEYLMNVKIYLINNKYIAVEGDVWGNPEEQAIRGFKIGTKVTWKNVSLINGKTYPTGVIMALKDNKKCLVKVDETGKTVELTYDDITKIEN